MAVAAGVGLFLLACIWSSTRAHRQFWRERLKWPIRIFALLAFGLLALGLGLSSAGN